MRATDADKDYSNNAIYYSILPGPYSVCTVGVMERTDSPVWDLEKMFENVFLNVLQKVILIPRKPLFRVHMLQNYFSLLDRMKINELRLVRQLDYESVPSMTITILAVVSEPTDGK